ncbi:uncharacterized protein LOC135481783 isoform X2 [Liolophura sinensis]
MKMNDINTELDDWPTHCAFFDKDTNFDMGPYLRHENGNREIQKLEDGINLLATKYTPLYHKFLNMIKDPPRNSSEQNVSDVVINMDKLPSTFDEEVAVIPVTSLDIPGHGGALRHKHNWRKVQSPLKEEIVQVSGDWAHTVKNSPCVGHDDVRIEILPSPDMMPDEPHVSQNSLLTSVRKQLSILFSKNGKRRFEREIYV